MNGRGPPLTLAPAGVLRGAAWPQASLDWAGEGADPADLAGAAGDTRFESTYAACLQAERRALWERTVGDDRFLRALALSSPSALARVRSAANRRDGPRNRAMRIVEHTLYRYLARAVGRVTPHGLWAGVSEVRFGAKTRVQRVAARHRFVPDLRPFQALMRALAARPAYRGAAGWVLNPTLACSPGGGWTFFARRPDGHVEQRALEAEPRLAAAIDALAGLAPMRLDRLAAEIAGEGRWPPGSRRFLVQMLDALAEGGVLVGGLDLPARFDTPWQALEIAAESLAGAEREAWRTAAARLGERCARLAGDLEGTAPDQLLGACDAARGDVDELAAALDLPRPDLPGTVLHCDLHLPWRLTLGEDERRQLLNALCEYETCWLRAASPAAAFRDAQRARLAAAVGRGVPLGEGVRLLESAVTSPPATWPAATECDTPEVAERLRAWEDYLRSPHAEVRLRPAALAPGGEAAASGCLFAAVGERHGVSLRSVSDLATLASARFAGLLDPLGLEAWVAAALEARAAADGWRLAELHAPFEPNPNVTAGPRLLGQCVSPWAADADAVSLSGARIGTHPPGNRLALSMPGAGEGATAPLAVVSGATAAVQSRDPVAQLLLWTGFHESPGRNQPAVDVACAMELAAERFTPRVRLPGGAVLRQRRTLLHSRLASLLSMRGAARFAAWQQLARELGWPQRLQVSVAGGERLRVNRDSPLAVEALFKGIGPRCGPVAVQEAALEPGLPVPGAGTHATELGIPFARRR